MKVICDNCRASYKIPDDKLIKPVNKATCRKCGHRMLIPRPRAGAGPDEKTLVTAVPPTPIPAPSRNLPDRLEPLDEEPETTVPGGRSSRSGPSPDDVSLMPATPAPVPERSTPSPLSRPSQSTPTSQPTPRAPEPRLVYEDPPTRQEPTPEPRQTRPRASTPTPLPSMRSSTPVPPPRASYDPAPDQTLAMLGGIGGVAGGVLLIFAIFTLNTAVNPVTLVLLGLGAMLSFGGSFVSLLIILTSGRGRHPGRRFTSLIVGSFGAIVVGGVAVGLMALRSSGSLTQLAMTAIPSDQLDVPNPTPLELPPLEPIPEGTADTAAPSDTAVADTATPAEVPEPPPKVETDDKSKTKTDPKPTKIEPTPAKVDPKPKSEPLVIKVDPPKADPPKADPPKADSPKADPVPDNSASLAQVPDSVIDTMLRNNIEIKRCFYAHKKETGTLPAKVIVTFTLEPSGQIHDAKVTDAELSGSTLDRCLGRAFAAIQMPATRDKTRTLKYPFNL